MSSLMPFAMQERGRGYFHWSSFGVGLSQVDPTRVPDSFYSPWGANGRVICQQVAREFPLAWLVQFQPGWNCRSVQLHCVEDNVILIYVLSGMLSVKCRFGATILAQGDWQFLPGILPETELQVSSKTRLLLLAVPHDSLRYYQASLPDLTEWLVAPTFYTWHEKQEEGELPPLICYAANNIATNGWKMSRDELWECYDRVLLFAMGDLGISLSLAGCDPEDTYCPAAVVSRVRASLLVAIQKSTLPPLSQLAVTAAHCGRALQILFKQHFGQSMTEYFLGAKMEAILRQIVWSQKPLQIIALEFGYQDYSTFSNAVSKWWGMSPRVIRKSGTLPPRGDRGKRQFARRPAIEKESFGCNK